MSLADIQNPLLGSLNQCRFGLSFLGSEWSEASLIGFAYAYEQRTNWRRRIKPYIAPTVELRDFLKLKEISETLSIKF